jgi:hypothetical protein
LQKAFEETAEFGRDLFIHMTSKYGVKFDSESGSRRITEIGIMVMVECPHLGDIWFRREGYTVDGHCKGCGEYVENWMDFEQVSGDLKKPRLRVRKWTHMNSMGAETILLETRKRRR